MPEAGHSSPAAAYLRSALAAFWKAQHLISSALEDDPFDFKEALRPSVPVQLEMEKALLR